MESSMSMTTVDVTTIRPLTHHEAMRRQGDERERTLGLSARSMTTSGRPRPTAPPGTSAGCTSMSWAPARPVRPCARPFTNCSRGLSQAARRPFEAAISAVQVRERSGPTPAQVIGRLADVAPRTVRGPHAHTSAGAQPRQTGGRRASARDLETRLPHRHHLPCATYGCTASTPPAPSAGHPN
jgi:hypothetical protein